MAQDYVPPTYMATAFNCPNCGAFAHQQWRLRIDGCEHSNGGGQSSRLSNISASICARCGNFALWRGDQLFYPQMYVAPLPTADMPEDVKKDYEEARSIFSQSSRGAAALLRLAIQKLVIALGESGDDLNKSIGNLVKKGLRADIQRALDVVRVVGNNAVHPGELDLEDNPEMALSLFKLTNLIVEDMITKPKEVAELFEALPEGAKDAITKRDKKA
jgi:hypothetical protein